MKECNEDKTSLIQGMVSSLTQVIELMPDKAAKDSKKIPLINEVIEEEDENASQSDGQEKDDSNILTNLT